MAWETPIYDRTLADAAYAKLHQGNTENLKGALNISDLNRIERNTVYLHDVLAGYGYSVDIETHGDWTIRDLFYLTDMDRIRQNMVNLISAYSSMTGTPTIVLGNNFLEVTDINDVEKILADVDALIASMQVVFVHSAQQIVNCGSLVMYIPPQSLTLRGSDGAILCGSDGTILTASQE